jgi:hypothetical protein
VSTIDGRPRPPRRRVLPRNRGSRRRVLWASYGHRAPPSARMCKRCSLLTELRRDRAEVSLFQWRKRRHIYRVAAAYAVVAWVLLQLVKAELLGGKARRTTFITARSKRDP